jgi:UDP-N-acetylglucosamine acyltransferase
MAYVHAAHDSRIGSFNTFANATQIGGHVEIGDYVTIGGGVAIHQFSRIGSYSMVGAESKVILDVLPFAITDGVPLRCPGINAIGLKRRGFSEERVMFIKKMFRILLYKNASRAEKLLEIQNLNGENDQDKAMIVNFISIIKKRCSFKKGLNLSEY